MTTQFGQISVDDSFRLFCLANWDFGQDIETDNDWVNKRIDLPYDANNRQLNAQFSRKLVGSSYNDYTFQIGKDYDYIIAFHVAPSADLKDLDE